ncbi:hypothetical protein K438DRAFT_1869465 [Mycena galopus ATCC 62051]|nr:hypothetical protein K438DRAFT_1869465 [Mycena galopus ATCC 62051]
MDNTHLTARISGEISRLFLPLVCSSAFDSAAIPEMFHPRASSRSIALILYLFSHLARCAVIPLPKDSGPSPSGPQGRAVVTGVQTVSNAVVSQTATGAPSTVTSLQAPKLGDANSADFPTEVGILPSQARVGAELNTSTATFTTGASGKGHQGQGGSDTTSTVDASATTALSKGALPDSYNVAIHGTATSAQSTVTSLQALKVGGANYAYFATTGVEVLPGQVTTGAELSTSTATFTFTFTSSSETVSNGDSTLVPVTILSTSLTLVPAPTSQSAASKAAATSNASAIAGGIVGAVILLIGGIVLWLFLRRRRRAEVSPARCPESPEELRDPFADINHARESWASYVDRLQTRELTPSNTISTRQLYISNQVHRAQEKVAELEEMSSLLLRSSTASSRGYSSRPGSRMTEAERAWTAPTNADQPVDDRLERAILEIQALNSRIREFEMQRRSSWALGLSDEPPPGYSE